jgi:multicomponent Na+:H+ antiporter subunit B
MTPRQRPAIALLGGALLAALMLFGTFGLPPFGQYAGPYGDAVNAAAPVERQVQNVVTAINFDYRGLDTLGEEYILFAAVAAAALLLRRLRTEQEEENLDREEADRHHPGEALHLWGIGLIACTLVFGLYMVLHAVTSPGGGFQGGCVLASAWLVVFLSGDIPLLHRVTNQHIVQLAEAIGAGTYAATGLAMLLVGGAFLQNLLPLGSLGGPFAGGMIEVINAGVGLEVTAGFVLILLEFLRQTAEITEGSA